LFGLLVVGGFLLQGDNLFCPSYSGGRLAKKTTRQQLVYNSGKWQLLAALFFRIMLWAYFSKLIILLGIITLRIAISAILCTEHMKFEVNLI
jgi:hypothetical protein